MTLMVWGIITLFIMLGSAWFDAAPTAEMRKSKERVIVDQTPIFGDLKVIVIRKPLPADAGWFKRFHRAIS